MQFRIQCAKIDDFYRAAITYLDADEENQELVIGIKVLNEENKAKLMEALAGFPIPTEATRIIEASGLIPESHTVDDETVRPITGGHGIGYDFQEWCTLGFVAQRDSDFKKVGVTAGHCEIDAPSMEGDEIYYQPRLVAGGTEIGQEAANTNPSGPRWSDSLLFLPSVNSDQGNIYRGSGLSDYIIQDKQYTQLVGESICKMGAATHETCGTITKTAHDAQSSTYTTLWDQNLADYSSSGGDSGAPVYFKMGFPYVKLYGTHNGLETVDGVTYKEYSPIGNIETDQGVTLIM